MFNHSPSWVFSIFFEEGNQNSYPIPFESTEAPNLSVVPKMEESENLYKLYMDTAYV